MTNPIQIKDALGVVIFKIKNFVFPDGEVGTAPVMHGPDGTPLLTAANPGHVTLDAQGAGLASDAKLELVRALLAGTVGVSAASLPLPTGAATDAKLEALRALLAGTLGVSAQSLPLPTGAATETTLEALRALVAGTLTVSVANEIEIKNDAGSPLPTRDAPGSAADQSVNPASLSGLNTLKTVAAGPRIGWSVQNQSINDLIVALDDGTGLNLTSYVLNGADAAGRQGGAINGTSAGSHQGRITIYGPAGSQVAFRTW